MGKIQLFLALLPFAAITGWSQSVNHPVNHAQALHQESAINLDNQSVSDELTIRINRAIDRIVFGKYPELTEDFLLAGVTLDPRYARRFTEFSGDQCGRYLSAFSGLDIPGNPLNIADFANKIIATQKPDGRFGNDRLLFDDPLKLEGKHMALLWGNGRLLTGLMDYYAVSKDPAVLQSAGKLGDFLLKTARTCMKKEVADRFKTSGYMGYICFTQITDGLVKLYEQTAENKYLESAASIYPLLPPPGNQHSHGFLNTLLGVMRLYGVTRAPQQLAYVENLYRQVVEAPEFLITGGVPEYFGKPGSDEEPRDEGCSEADFFMVSIALWKATGKTEYLERAEYCLNNELMYNQFDSGDFGSHPIDWNFGFVVAQTQARCWWCCDYHCLQAMLEAKKIIVTPAGPIKRVNLYAYTKFKDDDLAFTLSKAARSGTDYTLVIDSGNPDRRMIALRVPAWSETMEVSLNGKRITGRTENGYLVFDRIWEKQDRLRIHFGYALKITTFDRHSYSLAEMPSSLKKAAIQYGPYLLCVDDATGTAFLAEPSDRNVIYLPGTGIESGSGCNAGAPDSSHLPEAYLRFNYKHDGYYAIGQVVMRPVSEVGYSRQGNTRLWFDFEKQ